MWDFKDKDGVEIVAFRTAEPDEGESDFIEGDRVIFDGKDGKILRIFKVHF